MYPSTPPFLRPLPRPELLFTKYPLNALINKLSCALSNRKKYSIKQGYSFYFTNELLRSNEHVAIEKKALLKKKYKRMMKTSEISRLVWHFLMIGFISSFFFITLLILKMHGHLGAINVCFTHRWNTFLKIQFDSLLFLARACEPNRGLCDRFAVIDSYINIYLFSQ